MKKPRKVSGQLSLVSRKQSALKQCPFCAYKATIQKVMPSVFVACCTNSGCGAMVPANSRKAALRCWNLRAMPVLLKDVSEMAYPSMPSLPSFHPMQGAQS